MFGRRLGIATTAVGAAISFAMVGLSAPASASTVVFQNSNANMKITGGEVTAMNNCIADAKDGVIQTQAVACDQLSSVGNLVTLDGVSVWVTSTTPPSRLLFHGDNVSTTVTGGIASAINNCVADAKDGIIQTQIVACNQVATAGNLVNLSGVWVQVSQ